MAKLRLLRESMQQQTKLSGALKGLADEEGYEELRSTG